MYRAALESTSESTTSRKVALIGAVLGSVVVAASVAWVLRRRADSRDGDGPSGKSYFSGSAEGEEGDMFTVPDGPKLFSPGASRPRVSPSQGREGTAPSNPVGKPSIPPPKRDPENESIAKRTKVLNIARALLSRIDGVDLDESGSESDSEETDVSLHYGIATQLELDARDELLEAFDEYEAAQEEYAVTMGEEKEIQLEDLTAVLARIVEFLDISNEREKLYLRREILHDALGYQPRNSLPSQEEIEAEMKANGLDYRSALRQQALQLQTEFSHHPGEDSLLDQLLHGHDDDDEEQFEETWNDEGEAEFMEYLQQKDDALHTLTRKELQEARLGYSQDKEIAVVANGRRFSKEMAELYDEEEYEDIDPDEEQLEEEEVEEWDPLEKEEFERELFERVFELAEAWGVSAAVGEREALLLEEARRARKALHTEAALEEEGEEWTDYEEDEYMGDEEGEWMEDDEGEWMEEEEGEWIEDEEEEWMEDEEGEEEEYIAQDPSSAKPPAFQRTQGNPTPFTASRSYTKGGSPMNPAKPSVSPPGTRSKLPVKETKGKSGKK